MQDSRWILLDTETTGFAAPVHVVELAAHRMHGWEPHGQPFRKLLNQNADIPPEASRVHGYTREILERDGELAADVYREFARYVEGLPLVSYNSDYDLEKVLKPEWRRLGISAIGTDGFCALRLSQRLLDPVPAGNCKLQTLRQYYRLPERGAHTGLGDVMTVADLFGQVLRPIAEQRGLTTWEAITAYASEEWFPSRIAFGKHKGKSVWGARENPELREWLEWLARSLNTRSAKMGRWYLRQLKMAEPEAACVATKGMDEASGGLEAFSHHGTAVIIHEHPELPKLRVLVEAARARLAELEVTYTIDKANVDSLQASIFQRLRTWCLERDQLRLAVTYRKQILETLLRQGEEEAEEVEQEYQQAKTRRKQEYEETAQTMAARKEMTADEQGELRKLWKRLVNLYHPDRFSHEPDKLATYEKLTAAINHAKDCGGIETLRKIATDPHGFILRHGWASLDFRDEEQVARLRKLWESLELEILSVLEATNRLRESPDFELYELTMKKPEMLDTVVAKQIAKIEAEITKLKGDAEQLGEEIEELTAKAAAGGD